MEKKGRRLVIPALMVAGAMAVPAAVSAVSIDQIAMKAGEATSAPRVLDSQARWTGSSPTTIIEHQYGEVTWGRVVWHKGPPDY